MSAIGWFTAGLLAGATAMLGGMLLWSLAREATLRSRKVLLAGGLAAAAIAAMAAGASLAIDAGEQPAAAPEEPALAAAPPAPMPSSAARPTSSAMPPASLMSRILAMPGKTRTQMAAPMDQAAADLAARLERQGGTAADWSLLAQAYDFLGRPGDAQRARARAAQAGATQSTP